MFQFVSNSPIGEIDFLGERIIITENDMIVRDNINTTVRAIFRRNAEVHFTCSWNGTLHVDGSAYRRIEILTPGLNQWKKRLSNYDDNAGRDRTDTQEWYLAYSHEKDHWNSFNKLFAFIHMVNDFDEKNLCGQCNQMKEVLERQFYSLWNEAVQKSATYDTRGKQGGAMWPR